jgi:hypothetical protein
MDVADVVCLGSVLVAIVSLGYSFVHGLVERIFR